MNPTADHPPSCVQTTLSVVMAHKSGSGLSNVGGQRPFYHLLKMPFGAISGVAQLDDAHVFGVCLQCVSVPRNVTCDTNATRFKQSQPATSAPRLNNVIHQLIFISQTHPCARDSCLPFGRDVTDGLNVTYALSVCVRVFLAVVVYVLAMSTRQMLASRLSVLPGASPAALVLTCSGGSCSIRLGSPLLLFTNTHTHTQMHTLRR